MRLCYQVKIADLVKFIEEISKIGREKQKNFLNYGYRFIRECLLFHYGEKDLVQLSEDEFKFAQNFSPFVNPDNGGFFAEEFNKAMFHVERNANPSILFMDLSLKISKLLKMKNMV
jgi:DNA polymerase-3 subunit delta'